MIKKIAFGTALSTSILLTACVTPSNSSNLSVSTAPIADKTWIVTHINGEAISTQPTDRNIPSLLLDSKQQHVSGADGCNRIMGSYTLSASQIKFSQMASTMMACMDENIQKNATNYTQALGQSTHYQTTPSTLILKDKNGKAVLQFVSTVQPR